MNTLRKYKSDLEDKVIASVVHENCYPVVANILSAKNFSIVYAALGDKDRAFEALEQAIEERDSHVLGLGDSGWWNSLRTDS